MLYYITSIGGRDMETKALRGNKTFVEIVVSITPSQKADLKSLSLITKMSRSALMRQGISMILGAYSHVLRQ